MPNPNDDDNYDYMIKILMVGDPDARKSSLLARATRKDDKLESRSQIGVDYATRIVDVDDQRVKLQMWDTAGPDSFDNAYYKGTTAFDLCVNMNSPTAFENLPKWLKHIKDTASKENGDSSPVIILAAIEEDPNNPVITRSELEAFAKSNNLPITFVNLQPTNNNVDNLVKQTATLGLASILSPVSSSNALSVVSSSHATSSKTSASYSSFSFYTKKVTSYFGNLRLNQFELNRLFASYLNEQPNTNNSAQGGSVTFPKAPGPGQSN